MTTPLRRLLGVLAAALAVASSIWGVSGTAADPASVVPSDFSGIYVATPPLIDSRRSPPEAVYENWAAGGIYIRLVWDTMEPAPGVYDWSILDHELDRALPSGKRISIAVRAGGSAPVWLAENGVSQSTFVVGRGGKRRACVSIEVAWPWDPDYQDAYVNMMHALAAHLRSRPGAYEAVRIVKVTAIAQNTEEMRLPSTDGRPRMRGGREDPCDPSDAIRTWQEAGYRPSLVVQPGPK